jgi:hypothetical protein
VDKIFEDVKERRHFLDFDVLVKVCHDESCWAGILKCRHLFLKLFYQLEDWFFLTKVIAPGHLAVTSLHKKVI